MKKYYVYILLISLLNSILFFNYQLGINACIFVIPLLSFIIYILYKNNKINNKKGLLLIIPILLLSSFYFIYDNIFFKYLNILAITILFNLMYIYTIYPTYRIKEVLLSILSLLIEPLGLIEKLFKELSNMISKTFKINDELKNKSKSILIVLPIIVVVILLLVSADMVFESIFTNIFKIFKNISIDNIFIRLFWIIIIFVYLSLVIKFLLEKYDKKEYKDTKLKIDNYTIKILLTSLNIIYVIFDFIQIRSLLFHQVSNINYAEYARSGFFQLMFISIINLVIVLLSKYSKEDNKYNKIQSICMVFLTLIIIISSFLRMYMYEIAYGYTLLRLLVYVSLFTEVILLIPTVMYIINTKVNIFKYYLIIIITIYTILSLSPIDYIIAKRNINKYYKDGKIDLLYLENYSSDNVELLIELYNHLEDKNKKESIEEYFNNAKYYWNIKGFQDYNISRYKANNLIKDIK